MWVLNVKISRSEIDSSHGVNIVVWGSQRNSIRFLSIVVVLNSGTDDDEVALILTTQHGSFSAGGGLGIVRRSKVGS